MSIQKEKIVSIWIKDIVIEISDKLQRGDLVENQLKD